jgi:GT2 family glycosyltransferase
MTQPTISIIIPAARTARLPQILDALARQQGETAVFETWIVCNRNEQDLIPRSGENVHLLPAPPSTKAPARRNAGMAAASGDIFLFLDDDCVPAPDLVQRHLAQQRRGRRVVGGSVAFPPSPYLQLADNVSAFHDLLPFTPAGIRLYLVTANMSVRRCVVNDVGFMRPDLDRADDLEWTARFRAHGYSLYFDPEAMVWHLPPRHTWHALWRHWAGDAPDTIRVRLAWADMLRTPPLAFRRSIFLWGMPFIALWATGRTFAHRETRRRYWRTLPVVYLTKLAWCLSAYKHYPTVEQ